jgi:hypothetical protein
MSLDKTLTTKNNSIDSNDPFEEFEFKPLTEGLGFHNKEVHQHSKSMHDFNSKLAFRSPNLKFDTTPEATTGLNSPLPRNTHSTNFKIDMPTPRITRPQINVPEIEDDSIAKAQTAVNEILKNLNHKKQTEDALAKNKKRLIWKSTTPSILAAFLDSMLVVAGFLLMLIAMLTITKVDLISNMTHPGENYFIWTATAALFAAVTLIYMTVFRTYLGYTPGEWAFDQRCGTETQQATAIYVLKVTARTLLVMATGFLPITLISMALRTDLIGVITGLQTQKQSYV